MEVLTATSGIGYDEAVSDPITIHVAGRKIAVIGRDALIANKRAAGRLKDLADVEWLEAHPPRPR